MSSPRDFVDGFGEAPPLLPPRPLMLPPPRPRLRPREFSPRAPLGPMVNGGRGYVIRRFYESYESLQTETQTGGKTTIDKSPWPRQHQLHQSQDLTRSATRPRSAAQQCSIVAAGAIRQFAGNS